MTLSLNLKDTESMEQIFYPIIIVDGVSHVLPNLLDGIQFKLLVSNRASITTYL